MHPLTPNLKELKDDELQKKFSELNTKLQQAYRFGNSSLVWQMQSLLEDFQNELSQRQQQALEEKNDKHNLKNLIKVK